MAWNRKVTGKAGAVPAGIVLGLLLSLGVALAGAALTAYLVFTEKIGENVISYCGIVILVLSSAMGAWMAMFRTKRLRMQVCLLTGLCYYLLLLAITALLFGGQYEGMGATAFAVLGGCGAAALIGAWMENGRKEKHRKRAYR